MGRVFTEVLGDGALVITPGEKKLIIPPGGLTEVPKGWHGFLDWQHLAPERKSGTREVLAKGLDHNALTLEGAESVLATYFASEAQISPAAWYGALYTTLPTALMTGATCTTNELAGATGYDRQNVTGWTITQNTYWRATTNQLTYTAGSTWASVSAVAFINGASGQSALYKALSFIALSSPRTLVLNDVLYITYYIQLS
jgi:hypothetical protein